MKNIIFLFIILFSVNNIAQKSFSSIKNKVLLEINKYNQSNSNYKNLKILFSEFQNASKISTDNFSKKNIGIAFEISQENIDLDVFPALLSSNESKVNLSAFRTKATGKPSEDMQIYVKKFMQRELDLGSTKTFRYLLNNSPTAEGIVSENKNEHIIEEPNSLSFVRGNEDNIFVISIDNQYQTLENPRILIYNFAISLGGKNIFEPIKNVEEPIIKEISKENYPLYHDYRTNDIRQAIIDLQKFEPYKSNTELTKNSQALNENIDRYNINKYIKQFKYFLNLNITKEFLEQNFEDISLDSNEAVLNIKHISAHALADYYSTFDYNLAIEYYKKSIYNFPLIATSGTTTTKDAERITFNIAQTNYLAGNKDEAYAFLLGLIIDSNNNSKLAEKELNKYIENDKIDKIAFKIDIDEAIKSIKKGKNFSYNLTFREKKAFFFPMLPSSLKEYNDNMQNNKFYQSLK